MATNFGIMSPSDYKGLTLEKAEEKAKINGFNTRIVEIDGKALMLTMDFKTDRINFRVSGGIILEAYTG